MVMVDVAADGKVRRVTRKGSVGRCGSSIFDGAGLNCFPQVFFFFCGIRGNTMTN